MFVVEKKSATVTMYLRILMLSVLKHVKEDTIQTKDIFHQNLYQ